MQRFRQNLYLVKLIFCLLVGVVLWFLPIPGGVTREGWGLLAIFVATILAIILKPLPMGAISIISLTIAIATQTLSLGTACSGFGNDVVWLVVFAFFIAKGFITTGLGSRIAYTIMSRLGKNSLGLGYGLVATDLILAPCIPSVTARAGGIIYPILKGLIDVFSGKSHDPKLASFLSLTAFQGSTVTSAMFLTAMAGNGLVLKLAQDQGIALTWMSWAVAALVPGLVTLLILPYFLYRMWPPVIQKTPYARELALSKKEKGMAWLFVLLLALWIGGQFIDLKATTAAMIGLSILLVTKILHWKEILEDQGAWDTLIWFATLVSLACQLNSAGLSAWFSQQVVFYVEGFYWGWGFAILVLVYFYTHYFFASAVAHIGALFAPFLLIAIALGTPPQLAALVLGFFSNLLMGLTHYASGQAPIFFNLGHVSVGHWWKVGGVTSIFFIVIWLLVGGVWWKLLGIW
jgi:divalent anion:Na+ symporter, DASS family